MAKKLFNEEQKKQFIKYFANTPVIETILTNFFVRVGKVESDLGKDIAEMNYQELKVSFPLLGGRNKTTISWHLSVLKQYVYWCIANGKTSKVKNELELTTVEDIDMSYVYRLEMIKNPQHLQDILDITYPDVMEDTIYNIRRAFFWLVYNGLTIDEARKLKVKDIDLKNNIIVLKNKRVELYNFTHEILKNLLDVDVLYGTSRVGKTYEYKTNQGEYFFDIYGKGEINLRRAYVNFFVFFNRMYRKQTDEHIKLSYNRVFDSGVFYKWYTEGLNEDEIPIVEYMRDKEITNKEVEHFKSQIIVQYNQWKKAFGL